MNRTWIIIGSIFAVILIVFLAYRSNFNTANELQKEVDKSWANVQTSYQRRADLIPQLVATVKGAAAINPACTPPTISALVDPPSMVAVAAPVIAAEAIVAGLYDVSSESSPIRPIP